MSTKKFLELKQWNANHSSVWREIVSRFGQADYDDESIRTTREETLKAEWDAQEFGRNRQSEYPAIGDQLDMLFHAIDAGKVDKTSSFYTTLKAVKDKYPKG